MRLSARRATDGGVELGLQRRAGDVWSARDFCLMGASCRLMRRWMSGLTARRSRSARSGGEAGDGDAEPAVQVVESGGQGPLERRRPMAVGRRSLSRLRRRGSRRRKVGLQRARLRSRRVGTLPTAMAWITGALAMRPHLVTPAARRATLMRRWDRPCRFAGGSDY